MSKLLLVNPRITFPSSIGGRNRRLRSKEKLLNLGLLSIASHAADSGLDVSILDLNDSASWITDLTPHLLQFIPDVVGLSCQSCYGFLNMLDCASLIKNVLPMAVVIAGGQHAGPLGTDLLREAPGIDIVVLGEGERAVLEIAQRVKGLRGRPPRGCIDSKLFVDLDKGASLKYELYPNHRTFVPYVEESRGCTHSCSFCTSPFMHGQRIRQRSAKRIIEEISGVMNCYGCDKLYFFMEGNNFASDRTNAKDLAINLIPFGDRLSWRAESRVDSFPIDILDLFIDGGLRVLDLGLESGAPEVLSSMRKTDNPKTYLKQCVRIAERIAKDQRAILKVNIVLYMDETTKTIRETDSFLSLLASIGRLGISASPVMIDPGTQLHTNLGFSKSELEMIFGSDSFWTKVHSYPLPLSSALSFDEANKECLRLMQKYQDLETYFEVRRHAELAFGCTFEDFREEIKDIPQHENPWHPL